MALHVRDLADPNLQATGVNYAWTTNDLPDGVSVDFDPSANVKSPEVTIVGPEIPPFAEITVPNPGFEVRNIVMDLVEMLYSGYAVQLVAGGENVNEITSLAWAVDDAVTPLAEPLTDSMTIDVFLQNQFARPLTFHTFYLRTFHL